jgi:acyl-CoA dehydrogenase
MAITLPTVGRADQGATWMQRNWQILLVSVSQLAVDVAQTCLEICGMAGYQERSPQSIARILRDLYSARLMIGNERIMATNARLALAR